MINGAIETIDELSHFYRYI